MPSENVHSEQLEQELISALLLGSDATDEIKVVLPTSAAFANEKHKLIYEAILDMDRKTNQFSVYDVIAVLAAAGKLPDCGGRAYLLQLNESVCHLPTHGVRHAKLIRSRSEKEQIVRKCNAAVKKCSDPSSDPVEIKADLESGLLPIGEDMGQISPAGVSLYNFTQRLIDGDVISEDKYITTQIPSLNEKIKGIFKGDMCIVAGPPSMGKTSFAIGLALENIRIGKRILYVALDERREAMYLRILINRTGISCNKLLSSSGLNKDDQELVAAAGAEHTANDNLFIEDLSGATVSDIMALARRIKRKHGLDAVIVDYLQMAKADNSGENQTHQVTAISAGLKTMAKKLDVACIAVSQLNRTYDKLEVDQVPRATMLRGSGALEQDANLILFPWIPLEYIKKHYGEDNREYLDLIAEDADRHPKAYIVVGKNKVGSTGAVKCRWNPLAMRFYPETNEIEQRELKLDEPST